jgi:hypothetical protein
VKIPDGSIALDRLARIELMIELYRRTKQRRLVRLAMRTWRQTATDEQLARVDMRPARIH